MTITSINNTTQTTYQSLLIAVANGFVYVGASPPVNTIFAAGNQPTAPLNPTVMVSAAQVALNVYFVDGSTNIAQLNLTTLAMVPYVATAGTAPTDCCLAANWRGRLWLAGDSGDPQNFYQARAGVPTDWDYSQPDPAAAVEGNLSESGLIGEPITSLIPYTDDYALVGCSHSIWMFEGDLADGGTIVRVSDLMGIVGKDAWCVDPQGTLYFTASGGLYSVRPIWEFYQPPQLLTGHNFNQFFQDLSWGTSYISMLWDPDLHYCHLYITPSDGVTDGTHLILDGRSISQENQGSLWPIQFANVEHGPTTAVEWLSDASANGRTILLGGFDGYIRAWNDTALDDDGTTIAASVTFGPIKPFPEAAMWSATTIDFGETLAADTHASPVQVTGEVPTGAINGTNTVFTLAHTPIVTTQQVFINGNREDGGYQYTVSGSTITFAIAPTNGSSLTANYNYLGTPPTPWNADVILESGPDAWEVTEGTAHTSVTIPCILDRRQKTFRQRLRGGFFSLTISNDQPDSYFSFESALLEFAQAGRNRERR